MKVRELIEKLKEYDQEKEVMYWDAEYNRHYPALVNLQRKDMDKNKDLIVEIDREG